MNEQDLHWIEHFKETLNQPVPKVTHNFSMDESPKDLTLDLGEITREMLDAIKALKNNKATSLDQITAELLKCGEDTVVVELTNLLNKCRQLEAVPDEWLKGVIIKIPKKGNLAKCGHWKEITLLSMPGKACCMVPLEGFLQQWTQRLERNKQVFSKDV